MEKGWIALDKRLLSATHWVSPRTGETFPFPLVEKVIYLVMRDKWLYYVQELGNTFYESQESIAEACGTFRRKVNEVVGRFMEHGVIVAHKVGVARGVSLVYDEVHLISVVGKDKRIFVVGNKPHAVSTNGL